MAPWSRPIPEAVRKAISYDAETGEFVRIFSPRPSYIGKDPTFVGHAGYLFISVLRVSYSAARVAWYLHTGDDPGVRMVDHRDGNILNNRFSNLRLADFHQNNANRAESADKSSALPFGVARDKARFSAKIRFRGYRYNLGVFARVEDAQAAYNEAELWLRGDWASRR